MAVTLEWVRDHYDTDRNRRIDSNEKDKAVADWKLGKIADDQVSMVMYVHLNNTELPDYGGSFYTLSNVVSCNIPTGAMLKVNGVEVI